MTAATAERLTPSYGSDGRTYSLGVNGGSKCLKGCIAMRDVEGYARPGVATSTFVAIGVFEATYDNTNGNDGDLTAQITSGMKKLANGDTIADADVPCIVYVVDNQTVAKSSAGGTRPVAGVAVQVDSDGVRVIIEPEINTALAATSGANIGLATLAIGHADLTDADTQQTIDFASALPAGALVLGAGANVTAIFDNAGDTANITFDLGIKSGDTDGFVDGGSLDAVAKVSVPRGVAIPGLVGGITPSVIVDGSVNLDTLTKGAAVFYVAYLIAF